MPSRRELPSYTAPLFLVLALLLYGSLYPWHFHFVRNLDPFQILLHSRIAEWNRYIFRDVVLNVLIYIPLGTAAFLVFVRRASAATAFVAAVALGLAFCVSIELIQAYVPGRDTSFSDIECNTLGTVAGAALAWIFQPVFDRRTVHFGAPGLFLMAIWAGYQLIPFFPALSRTRVRAIVMLFMQSHPSAVDIWVSAAEWFAVAMALQGIFGRLPAVWLAEAMICLPMRLIIAGRTLGLNEVIGAALALLLWSGLGSRFRLTVALTMLFSAIVLRELQPFRFAAAPRPFSWVPFRATLGSEPLNGLIVLCRKAFDYGAAIWLLRAAKMPYIVAGAAMAVALAILEFGERYLPGRQPEITDAVVAALMALALWLFSDYRARRNA